MSWTCKGHKSTPEIKTFDSSVKQKVHNDENRKKLQSLIPVYSMFLPFHYDVKMAFFNFLTFQRTDSNGLVIFLMLEWQKHPKHFC